MKKSKLYYVCSECRQPCRDVERDFGIGAYEYWGARGVDTNLQLVSECCDGDLLTPEEFEELLSEEQPHDEN